MAALEAVRAELAKGAIRPVYVVTSTHESQIPPRKDRPFADPMALLQAAREIEAAALRGGDPALDFVKIDYIDGDHEAVGVHNLIAGELRAMSLFGGRRVVTVVHADEIAFGDGKPKGKGKAKDKDKSKDKDKAKDKATAEADEPKPPSDPLEFWLSRVNADDRNPPAVLILVAQAADSRPAAWRPVAAAALVVEVAPLNESALQEYLSSEGAKFGIKVHPAVAKKIWDRLGGADPARLRTTADRLLLDAGRGGAVTVQSVEDNVPMDRDAGVFAMVDAIADRDVLRALTVLHLMLEHAGATASAREEEAARLAGFLSSQFMQTALASTLAQTGKDYRAVAAELGLNDFRCQRMLQHARSMKAGRLELALQTIAELDIAMKSSQLGDRKDSGQRWLEQALAALARGTPLRMPAPRTVIDAL